MSNGKSYRVTCDTAEINLAMSNGLEVNYIGDDGGYAAIEIPDEKPKIKMTRTLPTEVGQYYFSQFASLEIIHIAEITRDSYTGHMIAEIGGCKLSTVHHGGYWAKVDESMFEFEGE
jgi:hypothetical protein